MHMFVSLHPSMSLCVENPTEKKKKKHASHSIVISQSHLDTINPKVLSLREQVSPSVPKTVNFSMVWMV